MKATHLPLTVVIIDNMMSKSLVLDQPQTCVISLLHVDGALDLLRFGPPVLRTSPCTIFKNAEPLRDGLAACNDNDQESISS